MELLGRKHDSIYEIIAAVLLIVVAAILALSSKTGLGLENADQLWIEDYYRDWIVRGIDVSDWQVPMAANYFPEWVIYGAARAATEGIAASFAIFMIVKLAALIILSALILRQLYALSVAGSLFLASFFACVLASFAHIALGIDDFWQIFSPAGHGGAFTNSLLALYVSLLWYRRPKAWKAALIALISTVSLISDLIFLAYFTLPVVTAMATMLLQRQIEWRKYLVFVIAVLVPIAVIPAGKIMSSTQPTVSVRGGLEGFPNILNAWNAVLSASPVHVWWLAAYLTAVVVVGVQFARGDRSLASFVARYALLITPTTFFAMALAQRYGMQYIMGGTIAAMACVFFPLVLRLTTALPGIVSSIIAVSLAITALVFSGQSSVADAIASFKEPYPEIAACLDSHRDLLGNGVGVADYWQVRKINLYTKTGIRIDNVIAGEKSPLPVQAGSGSEMLIDKKRTFAVTNTNSAAANMMEEDLLAWDGEPDHRIECGGFPIMVYDKGINIVTDGNREMIRLALEDQVRQFNQGVTNAVKVGFRKNRFTKIGQWKGRALHNDGRAGMLQFGPYIPLNPGTYRVVWEGSVSRADKSAGTVDVAVDGGTVIAQTAIEPANGTLAQAEFTLSEPVEMVEFRVQAADGSWIAVGDVSLSRMSGDGI